MCTILSPFSIVGIVKADLQGTTLSHATSLLQLAYDCCVRQKNCRRVLKHVLKRCDNPSGNL